MKFLLFIVIFGVVSAKPGSMRGKWDCTDSNIVDAYTVKWNVTGEKPSE
jgi:hypothetical protein